MNVPLTQTKTVKPVYTMLDGDLIIADSKNVDDEETLLMYLSEQYFGLAQKCRGHNWEKYECYINAAKAYTAAYLKIKEAQEYQMKGNRL